MENKIPTAEEYYRTYSDNIIKWMKENNCVTTKDTTTKLMIEFAKLHVEQALREALESIPCLGSSSDIATYEEVEEAVLNAYPPDKIK